MEIEQKMLSGYTRTSDRNRSQTVYKEKSIIPKHGFFYFVCLFILISIHEHSLTSMKMAGHSHFDL
jgi:hypothetical protein